MTSRDRKAAILRSACNLFARGGFSGMTTAALAKGTGVTEPILYRHFHSKRTLLHALLKETTQKMTVAMQHLATGATDPIDALRRICLGYPALARRHKKEFLIINRALAEVGDARTRALLRAHYESYETLLAGIIRDGQNQGQLRTDISAQVGAWHVIHAALGYLFTQPLKSPAHCHAHYECSLAEAALGGLLKGETTK